MAAVASPKKSKKDMRDIIAYYDDTRTDYHWLWLDKHNRAVHFGYYDENARKHRDALANLNRVLAKTVEIKGWDKVLDAGCGEGGSSIWLAENIGAEVVGITPVQTQVQMANEFIKTKGLEDRVEVKIGDYTKTEFADETFDVVWACESLCHADEKIRFYEEAYRILKPGGRLVIAEYIRAADANHAHADKLLSEWLHGWSINSIDTKDLHQAHAQQAGFSEITIRDVTQHTAPSLRVLYRLSVFLTPLGFLLRFLRVRSQYQHGNLVGSLRQYQALCRGYWFYGIINAVKP